MACDSWGRMQDNARALFDRDDFINWAIDEPVQSCSLPADLPESGSNFLPDWPDIPVQNRESPSPDSSGHQQFAQIAVLILICWFEAQRCPGFYLSQFGLSLRDARTTQVIVRFG